jgi:hypothetical protein
MYVNIGKVTSYEAINSPSSRLTTPDKPEISVPAYEAEKSIALGASVNLKNQFKVNCL